MLGFSSIAEAPISALSNFVYVDNPIKQGTATLSASSSVEATTAPFPYYVNGSSNSSAGVNGGSTAPAVTLPGSIANGDVILLLVAVSGQTTITTPAGYTLLGTQTVSTTHQGSLFYKVSSGSDSGATVTWTLGTSFIWATAAVVYRGANTSPIQAWTSAADTSLNTSVSYPALSGLANSEMLVYFGALMVPNGGAAVGTPPTGATGRISNGSTRANDINASVYTADEAKTPSGATSFGALTGGSDASVTAATFVVGLKPSLVVYRGAADLSADSTLAANEKIGWFGNAPLSAGDVTVATAASGDVLQPGAVVPITQSPTTAAAGFRTKNGDAGTSSAVATPSTVASTATKIASATTSTSPTTAASGSVLKPSTATNITQTPSVAAAGTKTVPSSADTSSAVATPSLVVSTPNKIATAVNITQSPATAADQTRNAIASSALTTSPTTASALGAKNISTGADGITQTPTVASAGTATKPASADTTTTSAATASSSTNNAIANATTTTVTVTSGTATSTTQHIASSALTVTPSTAASSTATKFGTGNTTGSATGTGSASKAVFGDADTCSALASADAAGFITDFGGASLASVPYSVSSSSTASKFGAALTSRTTALTEGSVYLPGEASNYLSVPDESALDITGDIDIRVKLAMDDWTPASEKVLLEKYVTTGNQRSYALDVVQTTGRLKYYWSANGTTDLTATSTASPVVSDGGQLWVRVTHDVDNGSSGNDVKFWTSGDGSTWTQLGSTVTTAGVTSIYSSTAEVRVGVSGISGPASAVAGVIYQAVVKNGIDGTTVLDIDCGAITSSGQTSFLARTGQTVTVNGASVRVSPSVSSTATKFGDASSSASLITDAASTKVVFGAAALTTELNSTTAGIVTDDAAFVAVAPVVTVASAGSLSKFGSASITTSPSTASAGIITDSASATITTSPTTSTVGSFASKPGSFSATTSPATAATLGVKTSTTGAALPVSPTTAAGGRVTKPSTATGITQTPSTLSAGRVTDLGIAYTYTSPTTTADATHVVPGGVTPRFEPQFDADLGVVYKTGDAAPTNFVFGGTHVGLNYISTTAVQYYIPNTAAASGALTDFGVSAASTSPSTGAGLGVVTKSTGAPGTADVATAASGSVTKGGTANLTTSISPSTVDPSVSKTGEANAVGYVSTTSQASSNITGSFSASVSATSSATLGAVQTSDDADPLTVDPATSGTAYRVLYTSVTGISVVTATSVSPHVVRIGLASTSDARPITTTALGGRTRNGNATATLVTGVTSASPGAAQRIASYVSSLELQTQSGGVLGNAANAQAYLVAEATTSAEAKDLLSIAGWGVPV